MKRNKKPEPPKIMVAVSPNADCSDAKMYGAFLNDEAAVAFAYRWAKELGHYAQVTVNGAWLVTFNGVQITRNAPRHLPAPSVPNTSKPKRKLTRRKT